MLTLSDAVFAPGQVLRTCPECGGDGWTETVTCRRCGGEGIVIQQDNWDGPFPEDSAHAGKRPADGHPGAFQDYADDEERGDRGWTN